jgi:hypothetical protein
MPKKQQRKKKPLHFRNPDEPLHYGKGLPVKEIKQFVNASYEPKKGETEKIGDYVLDKKLSTRKAKVYHDPVNDKTVIANRGTTGTVSDWANNARYVLGQYDKTKRMKQAEKVQRKAIEKYGKVDTNVGHSQAGIITRKLNQKGLTGEVINLNPAAMGEKQKKNEFVIRSATDPVSILHSLNPRAKKKNTKTTRGTFHLLKEHSADILDRLDPLDMIGKGQRGFGGVDGTIDNMLTNFDIDAYMEKLKVKDYHGSFVKNELPELNKGFYVINLNGSSHWTCLCKDIDKYGNNSYLYFDSFGFPAPLEVEEAIRKDNMGKSTNYFSMENQIQDMDHTSCGFYVIGWCKFLNNKKNKVKAYQDFIKKFTDEPSQNDVILKKLIKF